MKVKITETRKADTRNADSIPSKETLLQESKDHIKAVSDCMSVIAGLLKIKGQRHDHTKVEYIDEFYENFVSVMQDKTVEFKSLGWWKKHLEERHHLLDRCPEDVNLFDVLEMICDGCCAGLARSGEYRNEPLPLDILEKAYQNTIKFMLDIIEVEPSEK